MLKWFRGLVLGCAVVLANMLVVPPAGATSAPVIITHVQAGAVSAALREVVVLYNTWDVELELTGWCLMNEAMVKFACLSSPDGATKYRLPGRSHAVIASQQQLAALPSMKAFSYAPTNGTSGSLVGNGDKVTLLNPEGEPMSNIWWVSSPAGGSWLVRQEISQTPLTYMDEGFGLDWKVQTSPVVPLDQLKLEGVDFCLNLDGIQSSVPFQHYVDEDGNCRPIPPTPPLIITEVLPNAVGADEGKEFVELYNPNEQSINLGGYILWYGELRKSVALPTEILAAKTYRSFSDSELSLTLGNTSGQLMLTNLSGDLVYMTDPYEQPKEGYSWALFPEGWRYTSQPTPAAENVAIEGEVKSETATGETLKPCASNQYRSAETNRCRLIATASTTPTPCKDNQYRSEETGRCRNIATETAPAPCKEGQERNPETNRCRTVPTMSQADYSVLGAQTTQEDGRWYVWVTIGAILLLAISYAIYEWRYELRKLFGKLRGFVARGK